MGDRFKQAQRRVLAQFKCFRVYVSAKSRLDLNNSTLVHIPQIMTVK